MNNQELLDFINEKWPLGVNTSSDVPKLRFQRDDKLITGYSLNICKGLKVDSNNLLNLLKLKLYSKQITTEELYQVIYSILYIYLTKCLLQLNVKKEKIIAVGRSENGRPVLFGCDSEIFNYLRKPSIPLHPNSPIPPIFPNSPIPPIFLIFQIPIFLKEMLRGRLPFSSIKDLYKNTKENFGSIFKPRFFFPQIDFILFTPSLDNFEYTLDYLLFDNRIIFLNDFIFQNYYEHNIELINRFCDYFNNTKELRAQYIYCFDKIIALLKEKEIYSGLELDKILDLSELNNLMETYKYWVVKESIFKNEFKGKEIFPKGLIFSTDNINKKAFIDFLLLDGNIELNILGVDKHIKIPYKNIEPIKSMVNKTDIENNKLLWAERDRTFNNNSGAMNFFISEEDKIVTREYYQNIFSDFLNNFISCYLCSNYSKMRERVKKYSSDIKHTAERIDDKKYTKIVNNLYSDLNMNNLVDAVCEFAQYWNIKPDVKKYANFSVIEKAIRNLSFRGKIEDREIVALEKCFKISYINVFVKGKDKVKASNIRNLMNEFLEGKELGSYEKRKIIHDFSNQNCFVSYEKKLKNNIEKLVKMIADTSVFSLFKSDKNSLFLTMKKNVTDLSENLCQLPDSKGERDFLPALEKCTSFKELNSFINKYSTLFPENIRNNLFNTIGKMVIIDKINLEDFKLKTKTFLTNIYYDLDNSKEYVKDELKVIWEKRNAELEYNYKEEYSFEVTLDNLIKTGFLVKSNLPTNNGDSYRVNL